MMAGTHAGDPSLLSMRALYPHYLDMEVRNGNLSSRPVSANPPGAPKGPMFVSFKGGMRRLTDALGEALTRTDLRLGEPSRTVKPAGSCLEVETASSTAEFDHVLVTIPANHAQSLFKFNAQISDSLAAIPFASSVIVSVALPASAVERELCGTGFLTTFSPQGLLTGCTWTSNKWSHRAPPGSLLIRFFFGGAGKPDLTVKSDAELEAMALSAGKELLGLREPPLHVQISRWQSALPQYNMGHTDRVREIESALESSGITLAGSSYRGAGIPDCMRQGAEAAKKIQEVLT
jgi:protoporphyrinogen/coproporphyrinogen III oxidase